MDNTEITYIVIYISIVESRNWNYTSIEYNISKSAQQPNFIGWKCTPNYTNDKGIELKDKEPLR